ncbi:MULTISPECIES: type II secretion system F family protein [Pseudomonas aeruginosa group]|uniref:type II secretion system F family protein n=1 Tax=Pseudomonas aeruginosa group TaxID=136841 RepID=UPI001F2DDECD|nr:MULTISPECIES: type II secretion system F family protein [Pseudomonas aeruginosa group]MCP1649038.1 tight adherence protein B [Pseudomonas nitroreducens]MCP1685001.1 tight adherence protein B [Pseudomonas nitroreducens]
MSGALWLVVVSLALAALGVLLAGMSWRARHHEVVMRRLSGESVVSGGGRARSSHWLARRMRRAGIGEMRHWVLGAVVVCILLALFGQRLGGPVGALCGVGLGVLGFHGLLNLLYRRRLQKMIRQMPNFLDQVVRSLHSGRTLGDAITQAVNGADDPLREIFSLVNNHVLLGISLPEALQEVAELYDVEELHVLSLGVAVNHRYGGNTTDLLENIIKVIHEREKLGRQLRAMTGETRMSALVLALLPISLGGYILFSNPGYLMNMWHDHGGRLMLLTSLGLQVLGCYTLWRMLKSI